MIKVFAFAGQLGSRGGMWGMASVEFQTAFIGFHAMIHAAVSMIWDDMSTCSRG